MGLCRWPPAPAGSIRHAVHGLPSGILEAAVDPSAKADCISSETVVSAHGLEAVSLPAVPALEEAAEEHIARDPSQNSGAEAAGEPAAAAPASDSDGSTCVAAHVGVGLGLRQMTGLRGQICRQPGMGQRVDRRRLPAEPTDPHGKEYGRPCQDRPPAAAPGPAPYSR